MTASVVANRTMCIGSNCYRMPPPAPPAYTVPGEAGRGIGAQLVVVLPVVVGCMGLVALAALVVSRVQQHKRWVRLQCLFWRRMPTTTTSRCSIISAKPSHELLAPCTHRRRYKHRIKVEAMQDEDVE